MVAEAQIRDIFTLTGRGTVLVLQHGITAGSTRVGDTVSSGRGDATVKGIEFLDSVGAGKSWVCILVDIPDAREIFQSGDALRFTDPAEDTSS